MVPSFKKPDCRPPTFPFDSVSPYFYGYFARMTADGPLLCGGAVDGAASKKCFLLNSTGSWIEAPSEQWLPEYRSYPSGHAVEFAEGWWIAG